MKILASDYDGTFRIKEVPSKENIEAVHHFRKAGNAFGIVTGRSMETIRRDIEAFGIEFDFLIANNGGVIYDENYRKKQEYLMDYEKALELMDYIRTLKCASFVINDGYHRCRVVLDEQQPDYKYGTLNATLTYEEVMKNRRIAQLVISLHDDAYAHEIADTINEQYAGFMTAFVNINCIDIVPYGVSKGNGLQHVASWKGYTHDDIYAIGDSFNDIPMLQLFHGFSVAHALPEIQEQADQVVESVQQAIEVLMKISS